MRAQLRRIIPANPEPLSVSDLTASDNLYAFDNRGFPPLRLIDSI